MNTPSENTANARYIIDPVAFFAALVGGPILFTLATFWLLYVPVFALAFGGIPYLVIGAPVLLIHLRRHPAHAGDIAWVAFLAFCAAWAIGVAVLCALNPAEMAGVFMAGLIVLLFGAIFSACWGASFGWLYTSLARDFYLRVTPHSFT